MSELMYREPNPESRQERDPDEDENVSDDNVRFHGPQGKLVDSLALELE
jgi:hypothetical protein